MAVKEVQLFPHVLAVYPQTNKYVVRTLSSLSPGQMRLTAVCNYTNFIVIK